MTLVDAGPLIALFPPDDQHSGRCVTAFKTIRQPLGTVWPVLAEAMHLLASVHGAQDAVWR